MKIIFTFFAAALLSIGSINLKVAYAANTTPWPVGVMVGNPANGVGGQIQSFATSVAGSTSALAPLVLLNDYFDLTAATSSWPGSDSYSAGEWATVAPFNQGCPGNCVLTPLIGLPMTSSANNDAQNIAYLNSITAGTEDSMYKQFVDDWSSKGFKKQIWRPGVEMNLGSTAGADIGNANGYAAQPSVWINAYKHIYTVMHARAVTDGVNLKIDWNPGITNGQGDGNPTTTFWPGKAYVDVVAGDFYSSLYPEGNPNPYDWDANGQAYGGSKTISMAGFAADPIDLKHYYDFPASNGSGPDNSCANNGNGTGYALCGQSFSFYNLITFAKAQGLPIALDETGTDQGNGGPVTNTTFPADVRTMLNYATSQGVTVDHVSVWDNSGCNCIFTPTTGDGSTATATAWGNAMQGAPVNAVITPSPANTQVNGPISSITDTNGNVWSININNYLFENSTEQSTSYTWKTIFWTGSVLYVQSATAGTWTTINLTTGVGTTASAPSGYTAPHAASPANTQINNSVGTIYDTYGNVWAINTNQVITVNGTLVSSSAGVVTLFWTGTGFDQLNTAGNWYTQPLDATVGTATTTPTGYTAPHAASPANTQVNGTTGTIYDTTGDSFTINSSKQIVENGTAISSSANVVTLFWTGSVLDQLNSSGSWYTQPTNGTAGVATTTPTGYVVPVTIVAINMTPATRTVSTADTTACIPFASLVITDANSGQTETAHVSLSSTANGALSDPNSSTDGSTIASGVLTVSGTATAVATDLDAIRFTPTQNQVAAGSSVVTTITAVITDTAGETTSATSTVTAMQTASAISVSPSTRVSTTTDTTACIPFASLVITDANSGQTETAHVSLSSTANGALSDPNSSTDGSTIASGVITVVGTATGVATDIDAIRFTPTQNQVSAGLSVTTTITAGISDTAGETTSATATVTSTQVASGISITPTTQTVTTTDVTDAKPFTGMTISDTNTNQTESATVTINQTANGILKDPYSSTDGSVITNGILTVSGTSSAVITALGNVLFTPTKNQVAGGSSVTTTVTVLVTDTAAQTASATSTVIVTQIATHAVSSADTQVNGTSGIIYDTNGNAWTISSSGQEEENGLVVNNSSGITTLFWNGTSLYQLNSAGVWLTQPLNGSTGVVTSAPSGYVNLPSTPICTGLIQQNL
jgi:hypothetical protein